MGNIEVGKKPLISVIVPVYNVEKYIKQCVDSILAQTYRNLEIILVDDGSPDNCPQICDEYAKKDSRVRVIHKQNGGLSDARNAALDIAKGTYIGFVDSDDWIETDMFEYLLDGILGSKASIACCEVINVYEQKVEANKRKNDVVYYREDAINELLFFRIENYAWNKLYDADLWNNIRFPVGKNFEDILTIYKVFEISEKVFFLKDAKYYYRRRDDGISGKRDLKNREHYLNALIERYEDMAVRMPMFKWPLFRRLYLYDIPELSKEMIQFLKKREETLKLVKIITTFIQENIEDICKEFNWGNWERKKLECFSKGTIIGCFNSLKYHNMLKWRDMIKKKMSDFVRV